MMIITCYGVFVTRYYMVNIYGKMLYNCNFVQEEITTIGSDRERIDKPASPSESSSACRRWSNPDWNR